MTLKISPSTKDLQIAQCWGPVGPSNGPNPIRENLRVWLFE